MTKELHIFRGIPGSGKTTAARKLIDDKLEERFYRTFLIDEDEFFNNPWGTPETYKFDPTMREVAHDYAFARAMYCLHHDYHDIVVVAGVFPKMAHVQRYVDAIWNSNIDSKVFIHDMNGGYTSVHGVPESHMDLFRIQFESWPHK